MICMNTRVSKDVSKLMLEEGAYVGGAAAATRTIASSGEGAKQNLFADVLGRDWKTGAARAAASGPVACYVVGAVTVADASFHVLGRVGYRGGKAAKIGKRFGLGIEAEVRGRDIAQMVSDIGRASAEVDIRGGVGSTGLGRWAHLAFYVGGDGASLAMKGRRRQREQRGMEGMGRHYFLEVIRDIGGHAAEVALLLLLLRTLSGAPWQRRGARSRGSSSAAMAVAFEGGGSGALRTRRSSRGSHGLLAGLFLQISRGLPNRPCAQPPHPDELV